MFETDFFSVECGTCHASGTTACSDCVVTHLLANDDGPIHFLTTPAVPSSGSVARAIELFELAGLVDTPVEFVSPAEFESFGPSQPRPVALVGRGM